MGVERYAASQCIRNQFPTINFSKLVVDTCQYYIRSHIAWILQLLREIFFHFFELTAQVFCGFLMYCLGLTFEFHALDFQSNIYIQISIKAQIEWTILNKKVQKILWILDQFRSFLKIKSTSENMNFRIPMFWNWMFLIQNYPTCMHVQTAGVL